MGDFQICISVPLNELLTFFKNGFEAKERSLSCGHNFNEKQDKIGKFSTSSLLSVSGSAKFSYLLCEGNNHSSGSVYFKRVFVIIACVQNIRQQRVN